MTDLLLGLFLRHKEKKIFNNSKEMCNWTRLAREQKLPAKKLAQLFTLFVLKNTKKNQISYIFFFPFLFVSLFPIFALSLPTRPLGISNKKIENLSVARLGPRGASQILWVSKTRTSIAHANVSGLEFADERNEGQEAEAKARAKRRRYNKKTHITIHFFNFLFSRNLMRN